MIPPKCTTGNRIHKWLFKNWARSGLLQTGCLGTSGIGMGIKQDGKSRPESYTISNSQFSTWDLGTMVLYNSAARCPRSTVTDDNGHSTTIQFPWTFNPNYSHPIADEENCQENGLEKPGCPVHWTGMNKTTLPSRSQFAVLQQICNLIPTYLGAKARRRRPVWTRKREPSARGVIWSA